MIWVFAFFFGIVFGPTAFRQLKDKIFPTLNSSLGLGKKEFVLWCGRKSWKLFLKYSIVD